MGRLDPGPGGSNKFAGRVPPNGDEAMPPDVGRRATGTVMVFVGVVAPRAEAPTELPSWHRLSDRDVSFEGKRCRQRVTDPQVPMGDFVPKRPPLRHGAKAATQ